MGTYNPFSCLFKIINPHTRKDKGKGTEGRKQDTTTDENSRWGYILLELNSTPNSSVLVR